MSNSQNDGGNGGGAENHDGRTEGFNHDGRTEVFNHDGGHLKVGGDGNQVGGQGGTAVGSELNGTRPLRGD